MVLSVFQVLHVFFVILFVATTFAVFANPSPTFRKPSMIYSGIGALAVLLTGFGLHGMLRVGFPLWLIVKILCWLAISILAGMAFRNPKRVSFLRRLCAGLVLIAVLMVYFKPF